MIYYNEIDPNASAWLRQLINDGHLPHGDVDTQCHFFAGIGGWSLALQLAGIPTHIPLWTGSCPCQPFSAAGKRGGFADERHLWPYWQFLIEQRRPAIIFGEQVASAADWLRLVRSDLEALDYAVGAVPIEAASAGADHLRDRFWFVGHLASERWREGRTEYEIRGGRATASSDGGAIDLADPARQREHRSGSARPLGRPEFANGSGVGLADAHGARSQGRTPLPERPDQRTVGADGVADSNSARAFAHTEASPSRRATGQRSGADARVVGDGSSEQSGRDSRAGAGAETQSGGERFEVGNFGYTSGAPGSATGTLANAERAGPLPGSHSGIHREQESPWSRDVDAERHGNTVDGTLSEPESEQVGTAGQPRERERVEWVRGADGKARRVKSGVRLLAHGVPNRVGLLRGFGNAIDPRPAATFIKASFLAMAEQRRSTSVIPDPLAAPKRSEGG